MAEAAKLSPRQLCRVFTAETGQSPAKAVEGLRLDGAAHDRAEPPPVGGRARETGFRDRRRLCETFLRGYGMPPRALRRGKGQML
ncbi:helix-turn-helix domain-containing protein [Pseudorhodoferax soli]|uniref:helix-turn-helix domain-containing protein n=1 Tax=Pseudorhodoferax soli TaxID=545864 RepID=UPI0014754C1A